MVPPPQTDLTFIKTYGILQLEYGKLEETRGRKGSSLKGQYSMVVELLIFCKERDLCKKLPLLEY